MSGKNKPIAVYFEVLNYDEENREYLHESFDLIVRDKPSSLTPEDIRSMEILFAPLGYYYGADIMEHAPNLRAIATNTTGVPHIDVELAQARQIKIYSLKDDQEFLDTITPTAEHAMGLIMALTRNLLPATRFVEQGNWGRWDFAGNKMLSRQSLGIVGLGRLGKKVAQYAKVFGMEVAYYDPYCNVVDVLWQRKQSLDELCQAVDIVTVHVPANSETQKMFSLQVFEKFKPGAIFINTARGEVVDSEALLSALKQGWLGGAALDVVDGEFVPGFESRARHHPLIQYAMEHDNLIITPHIAGSTRDAWYLTQRRTIEKLVQGLDDQTIATSKIA